MDKMKEEIEMIRSSGEDILAAAVGDRLVINDQADGNPETDFKRLDFRRECGRQPADIKENAAVNEFAEALKEPGNPTAGDHFRERIFLDNQGVERTYQEAVELIQNRAGQLMDAWEKEAGREISPQIRHKILKKLDKSLWKQQHTTDGRGIGEHGIKHILGNVERSDHALNQYGATAKERLAALIAQVHHDEGYMDKHIDQGKIKYPKLANQHDQRSSERFRDRHEKLYAHLFDDQTLDSIERAIGRHNRKDPGEIMENTDFSKDKIVAAVHLADKMAISEPEKFAGFLENPQVVEVMQGMYYIKNFQNGMTEAEIKDYGQRLRDCLKNLVEHSNTYKYIDSELKQQFFKAVEKDISAASAVKSMPMSAVDIRNDCISFRDTPDGKETVLTIGLVQNEELKQALGAGYTKQVQKIFKDLGYKNDAGLTDWLEQAEAGREVSLPGRNLTVRFEKRKISDEGRREIFASIKRAADKWQEVHFDQSINHAMEQRKKYFQGKIKEGSISGKDIAAMANILRRGAGNDFAMQRINILLNEFSENNNKNTRLTYAKKFIDYIPFTGELENYLNEVLE